MLLFSSQTSYVKSLLFFMLFFNFSLSLEGASSFAPSVLSSFTLRDNLKRAKSGDYLVTTQNKNYTLLHVYATTPPHLVFEEITVPSQRLQGKFTSWKKWMEEQAPGHTSWVIYTLDLRTGQLVNYYSVTKKAWYDLSKVNNFLTTLLNLKLEKLPLEARRRIGLKPILGRADTRPLWQPRLIVEGQEITEVSFDVWVTLWPKDDSELANKTIELYLPQDNEKYPSYFPYWLQINGMIGSAKVRIVDSGSQMPSTTFFPK